MVPHDAFNAKLAGFGAASSFFLCDAPFNLRIRTGKGTGKVVA
jgi:hypothetical protein